MSMMSDDVHEKVLESTLDPNQWALELERVVPRLMQLQQSLNLPGGGSTGTGAGGSGREWRERLKQTKLHQQNVIIPEGLLGLSRDLATLNERIRTKETFINAQFESSGQDFASTQAELKKVQAQHAQL